MNLDSLSPIALLAPMKTVKCSTPQPCEGNVMIESSNSEVLSPLCAPVMSLEGSREFSFSLAHFKLNESVSWPPPRDGVPLMNLHQGRIRNSSQPLFAVRRPIESMDFDEICLDPSVTINPQQLQFIPAAAWPPENISFGLLVSTFFRKRNSMHCKFPYKLYNALKMTQFCPEFTPHVGVEWITDSVFRVHRVIFARLLGVRTVDGGLFHQQGNFPSHGFLELPFEESDRISRANGLGPADLSQVRFMTHSSGQFVRQSTEADLGKCRWNGK